MPFDGVINKPEMPRKESASWKRVNKIFPNFKIIKIPKNKNSWNSKRQNERKTTIQNPKTEVQFQKLSIHVTEILQIIMFISFLKLMKDVKLQIYKVNNIKENKYQKICIRNIMIKLQKTKDKGKMLKRSPQGEKSPYPWRKRVRCTVVFLSKTRQHGESRVKYIKCWK